jgi:outer membrane protein assembly factor BamB
MGSGQSLIIYPGRGHTGGRLLVRIRGDAPASLYGPSSEDCSVRIGDALADDVLVRDTQTLICRVPNAPPGAKSVAVKMGPGEWREDRAFHHLGPAAPGLESASAHFPPAADAAPPLPSIAETSPSSNWWMIHQDLAHAANSFTDRVVPLWHLWTRTFPGTFYVSQPIVGDRRVLVGLISNSGITFVAVNAATGAVQWARTQPDWDAWGHAVAANARVYFVERRYGDSSRLVCLSIANGAEVWRAAVPAGAAPGGDKQTAGLAAAFRQVFLQLRSGHLRAYAGDTGNLNWEAVVAATMGSTKVSSPAVGFGNVYAGTDQGLRAFNAATGAGVWAAGPQGNGGASPVVVSAVGVGNPAVVVIGCDDRSLRAYNASGGGLIWTFASDCEVDGWAPACVNNRLYLWQSGFRKVVEIDAGSGLMTAASTDLGGRLVSPPTAVSHFVLAVIRSSPGNNEVVWLKLPGLAVAGRITVPEVFPGDETRVAVESGRAYLVASMPGATVATQDTIRAFRHKAPWDGWWSFLASTR